MFCVGKDSEKYLYSPEERIFALHSIDSSAKVFSTEVHFRAIVHSAADERIRWAAVMERDI